MPNILIRICECAQNTEPHMFLNGLRNRLQPHAKPVLYIAHMLNQIIIPLTDKKILIKRESGEKAFQVDGNDFK